MKLIDKDCEFCGGDGEVEMETTAFGNEMSYYMQKCGKCNSPVDEDCYDPDN